MWKQVSSPPSYIERRPLGEARSTRQPTRLCSLLLPGTRTLTCSSRCAAAATVISLFIPLLLAGSLGGPQKRPVYVSASLVDRNNLFIENLNPDEIQILEDGKPREIEFMASVELPTVYGIVFDRTMLGAYPDDERTGRGLASGPLSARNIAYQLIDKHLARQAVWVGYYDQGLQVVLEATSDGFQAHRAVQEMQGVRNPEPSFLYGALLSAVQHMNQRPEKRRVLLFFLEDVDTRTLDRLKPLRNLLSASNVELFLVRFGSRLHARPGAALPQMSEAAIRELSGTTAGDSFVASTYGEHMEDLARRIYNHIRTIYTFGFSSESTPERPLSLTIKCTLPGSRVRSRSLVPSLP